ncbi:uncharacterized protein MYCFIDRAFT_200286 [Pseudocercospora fijiensis CIRAD86]|uniref:ABM domain-containing protein n=1 Tax=Pseudocercospora fijiensis (strain CIRAD86) TaxID=383855 RepID=M3AKA7_PSEFD|nr:uncharacterized protein MYCFIDRAFT_200286 [Pseudocercospora fijiensis CIRAD86]EME77897.1 hypothetical protein MYCFIDRAFT_200286 [Pseudocercospora fijiensis CIRAD86]
MFITVFEETIPASRNVIAGAYYTKLRPPLQDHSGFISENGYTSPSNEKQHLVLAKFTSPEAARNWRTHPDHLRIQHKSRQGVFEDYRVRSGAVVEPSEYYTADDPTTTTSKRGRYLIVYEEHISVREQPGLRSHIETALLVAASGIFDEAFDITPYANDQTVVWLISFATKKAAVKCRASQAYGNVQKGAEEMTHLVRVERDYGRFDRKEAPCDADVLQKENAESPPVILSPGK